jgi:hypothetical protein
LFSSRYLPWLAFCVTSQLGNQARFLRVRPAHTYTLEVLSRSRWQRSLDRAPWLDNREREAYRHGKSIVPSLALGLTESLFSMGYPSDLSLWCVGDISNALTPSSSRIYGCNTHLNYAL